MSIRSKPANEVYRSGYDAIFGKGELRVFAAKEGVGKSLVRQEIILDEHDDFHALMNALAEAWYFGGWEATTFNERLMQGILEDYGYWPYLEEEDRR